MKILSKCIQIEGLFYGNFTKRRSQITKEQMNLRMNPPGRKLLKDVHKLDEIKFAETCDHVEN